MTRIALFALAALALTGCIQSTATADDPDQDAAVDAAIVDGARPVDAAPIPPDPEPGPSPDCGAVPACPPGYDRVEACDPSAVCETIAECGLELLCQICPPGAGFICDEGAYEVEACTNDATCYELSDCSGSIACESCSVCPEGLIEVDYCPIDAACWSCPNVGDEDVAYPICAPADAVRCPPRTRPVEGCLPADQLCWVLDDGSACLSANCPYFNPCGGQEARRVRACPENTLGCFEREFCGEALICETISHDCDDCEPGCPMGYSPVPRCEPNGRDCVIVSECCAAVACESDQ